MQRQLVDAQPARVEEAVEASGTGRAARLREVSHRFSLYGLFHARRLRVHELALRAGWDRVHAALRVTEPFYDRFVPAISTRDFAFGPSATSIAPWTSWPC